MQENMSTRKHGLAIIGCGRIGVIHLKNALANKRAAVRWVVEADQFVNKAHDLIKTFEKHEVKVAKFSDLEAVLCDPQVDAVIVCTPTDSHEAVCLSASHAGKAIFCEKPLSTDLAAIERMYVASEKAGKPFFCAFSRRFDPQLRRLHDLVRANKIGQLRMVKSISRDPSGMSIREYLLSSGGVFIDAVVHDVDQLLWLAGETPEWVMATGHATNKLYQECGDVDSAMVMMKFPGGVLGQIEVSRETKLGYDQRIEVLGNEGLLVSENQNTTNLRLYSPDGIVHDPVLDEFSTRYKEAYEIEMDHFLQALDGNMALDVTRRDAEAVHKVCHACKLSHESGEKIYIN